MKTSLRMAGLAFVLSTAAVSAAGAQSGKPNAADRAARIERAKERGAMMRQKFASLSPEQKAAFKAYMEAYKVERMSLRDQVKAGTLDKKSAAEQLKAWREANRPKKP